MKSTVILARLLGLILCGSASVLAENLPFDLQTPAMTAGPPAAGQRTRMVAPEYAGTDVYHALYLPSDWVPGGSYPVIVEYTGNRFPPTGSTGEVKDANLGYGISGGQGFIWVSLPYIETDHRRNALNWWGDPQATIDYCKLNVPRICREFGGDPARVLLCGFSRGALGVSYLGLADDEIASLWQAVLTHDHFDGEKEWGYPQSDRASALQRLARLNGRPALVSSQHPTIRDDYLNAHLHLAEFTFLVVPIDEIFTIPEGNVIHPHTDLWMHKPSTYRTQVRTWVKGVKRKS